jgi:ABC-type multidrug transport system fused ATPase/permease subunit
MKKEKQLKKLFLKRIQQFISILQRYILIVRWILKDGLFKYKFRVTATILAGSASGLLQASAVGQAIYYAKLLEKGESISFLGQQFDPRTSVALVACVSGGVLLTLLLAATMEFYSRRQAIRINGLYEDFCSKRALETVAKYQVLHNSDKNQVVLDEKIVRRICHADSRLSGRSLRTLLGAVAPLTQLTVYTVIIFYVDYIATLAVIFFTILAVFFLFKINQSATSGSRLYEQSGPEAMSEKTMILNQICTISQFCDTRDWIDRAYETGQIKTNINAYENRLAVIERSRFVTGILTAVIIGAAIGYFGIRSLVMGSSWGALLAYIFILVRSMKLLVQLSTIMTAVNCFYPQVKRYREFIIHSRIEMQPDLNDPALCPISTRSIAQGAIPESEKSCIFQQGHRYLLFSPILPNRYSLSFIFRGLFTEDKVANILANTCFVAKKNAIPSVPLRDFLQLPENTTQMTFLDEIRQSGIESKHLADFPDSLDAPLSVEQWNGLDIVLKYVISLEAVRRSHYAWALVDEHVFKSLPSKVQDFYLDQLKDRTLIIVCSWQNDFDYKNLCHADQVIVLGDSGPIGIGTPQWAFDHKKEILSAAEIFVDNVGIADSDEECPSLLEE